MTVSLVKRPKVTLYATRATVAQAERHFAYGGTVLVSERGEQDSLPIGPETTTHNRDAVSWEDLRAQVTLWRNRYPRQRYFTLLHCAAVGDHHSDDRATVWHGDASPLLLCGMHAQVLRDGTPEAAARAYARLTPVKGMPARQPAKDLFLMFGKDYPTTEGSTVNSKASESVRTIVRLERLQHSASGNPRFRVHFADGTSARTRPDSMFVGALSETFAGTATVKIDGRGNVWDIEPVTPDHMTTAQDEALRSLCGRYGVAYDAAAFRPVFDLPAGWVAGWVGGNRLYVGCSPDGAISS